MRNLLPYHCFASAVFGSAVCMLLSLQSWSQAIADVVDQSAKQWEQTGWPLLETYCVDCHSPDYSEAEVDLTLLKTLEGVRENGDLATHVLGMIRFGAMPPEDAELPTSDERREMADRLDNLVFHSTCDLRPRPGKTTARRLNRAEYNHAIRDLFGMDLRPADRFPSDEVGGGFDNNADVLSLSPMLMDKYLTAAEFVTSQIIVDPETLPNVNQTFTGVTLNLIGDTRTGSFGQRYVQSDGVVWVEFDVPVGGQYSIEMIASPSKADYGKVLSTMHSPDGILKAVFEHESRDSSGSDDHESTRLTLAPGKSRYFFRTTSIPAEKREELLKNDPHWQINESRFEPITQLTQEAIEASRLPAGTSLKPDRKIDEDEFPFRFRSIVVRGPSESTREDLPPAQRMVLRKMASKRGDYFVNVAPSAKECLKPILTTAFRTPVTDEDLAPYVSVVEQMTERGSTYHEAMRVAISAVLVSPRFLFRVEVPETDADRKLAESGQPVPLSSNQLASRLSFFLWSSLPDDRLLKAASNNELKSPKKRIEHVRRMLSDPKAESLGSEFARQWFGLGGLSGRDFSELNRSGRSETPVELSAETLSRETEALFLHLLRDNRPVTELLTADYTFANEDLTKWYGLDRPTDPKVPADQFIQINGVDPARPGILGHAGVLALTSYPIRTSPVQRGKWILENVLGTPPPEAPPGVPGLEETKTASADATLREQLELHRADPGCASCHRVMDSLGFGLEEFDHLGRLRSSDNPARREAGGELPGGRAFQGTRELATLIADSETRKLAETAVRRMLAFAIGRELRPSDRCFVEAILDETAKNQYRVRDLLEQVIESPPFLNHQAELPTPSDQVADDTTPPTKGKS
ncbi:DUF1592 domain-containing protein [Neorhodopirellula pilleata]|uniref:Planctomycete cytochrome C n=1 Tax=Neorhodopirellula pilleata TaxID=2714738 RepID=A0A5C6AV57_9BACT|nr:DUF1592 domain-containing protein [Neorhodopirellula pilleata]TWU03321.1 hypothetical protein Pla100_02390 [Neorhodopirellula pilleata]